MVHVVFPGFFQEFSQSVAVLLGDLLTADGSPGPASVRFQTLLVQLLVACLRMIAQSAVTVDPGIANTACGM
jgi:hypothetical protein